MGYSGLWVKRDVLKIDSKNHENFKKNAEKIRDI